MTLSSETLEGIVEKAVQSGEIKQSAHQSDLKISFLRDQLRKEMEQITLAAATEMNIF